GSPHDEVHDGRAPSSSGIFAFKETFARQPGASLGARARRAGLPLLQRVAVDERRATALAVLLRGGEGRGGEGDRQDGECNDRLHVSLRAAVAAVLAGPGRARTNVLPPVSLSVFRSGKCARLHANNKKGWQRWSLNVKHSTQRRFSASRLAFEAAD